MTGDYQMVFIRALVLSPGLVGLYFLLASRHLSTKIFGWLIFKLSLIFLWLTVARANNGVLNPFPRALTSSILEILCGTSFILLILLLGVFRQYGSLKEKEINQKENA